MENLGLLIRWIMCSREGLFGEFWDWNHLGWVRLKGFDVNVEVSREESRKEQRKLALS